MTGDKEKYEANVLEARRMIYEMIEASMALAQKKGAHLLEDRCNCIACVNKRKAILKEKEPEWTFRL